MPATSQHERPGLRRALREINIRPLSYPNREDDIPADQSVLIIESDVDNNSPAPAARAPSSQASSGANISVIDLTDTGEYIA